MTPSSSSSQHPNYNLDNQNSQRYRRLFESNCKYAERVNFSDNFSEFYSEVFENVEAFPDPVPSIRCPTCEECFLSSDHHSQQLLDNYTQYFIDEKEDISKAHNDCWSYIQTVFPGTDDLEVELNAGEWGNDHLILNHLNKWRILFESLGDGSKINKSQIKLKLTELLDIGHHFFEPGYWRRSFVSYRNKHFIDWVDSWSRTESLESTSAKENDFLDMLSNLLETLYRVDGENTSPEEICKQLHPKILFGTDPYRVHPVDFLLPAFLIHSRKFTDWGELAWNILQACPRLSVALVKVAAVLEESGEKSFHEIGSKLTPVPGATQYVNLCLILGKQDLQAFGIALSQECTPSEIKQLAAIYLQEKKAWNWLKVLGNGYTHAGFTLEPENLMISTKVSKENAAIFLLRLVKYQLAQGKVDDAIENLRLFLDDEQLWNCILLLFKTGNWDHLIKSKEIAKMVLEKVKSELDIDFVVSAFARLVLTGNVIVTWGKEKLRRIASLVWVVSAAIHVLPEGVDNELEEHVKNCMGICLQMTLQQEKDADVIMALTRAPGFKEIAQNLLERNGLLNVTTPFPIQPCSNNHAWLLFLRGVYHYKILNLRRMFYDFNKANMITTSPKIPQIVSNFIAGNPIVHEYLLAGSNQNLRQIRQFLLNYRGNETFDTSEYPWIFQNINADLSHKFSDGLSTSGNNLDLRKIIVDLEKKILKGDEMAVSAFSEEAVGDDDIDSSKCHENSRWSYYKSYWDPFSALGNHRANKPIQNRSSRMEQSDIAEKGYHYIGLSSICSDSPIENIFCKIMAAHFFLNAMQATSNISRKYGFRALVLECMNDLEGFTNLFQFPKYICLFVLRTIISFTIKADHCLSYELHQQQSESSPSPGLVKRDLIDKYGFNRHYTKLTKMMQDAIAIRVLCPLVATDIYTAGDGIFAIISMRNFDAAFISKMAESGVISERIPEHLFPHYLLIGIWMGTIPSEKLEYEPPAPEMPPAESERDSNEEKERKRKLKLEYDEYVKFKAETSIVNRIGFQRAREIAMGKLAHLYGDDLEEIERMMCCNLFRRTEDGFLDPYNWTLNFDGMGQGYSRFVGVEFDKYTGELQLVLEKASFINGDALFSDTDLVEIFGFDIIAASLSFDEDNYCKVEGRKLPKYADLPHMFNPFNKVRFSGLSGDFESLHQICGTYFHATLYHLDLLAKILSTGQEVSALFPFKQRSTDHLLQYTSECLKKVLTPISERQTVVGGVRRPHENFLRMWFYIDEVEQVVEQWGSSHVVSYGDVKITLKTKPMSRGADGELHDVEESGDTPGGQFVREFNENMKKLSHRFRIIARMCELAKISACLRFLQSNREFFHERRSNDYKSLVFGPGPCDRPFSKCTWRGVLYTSARERQEKRCKCTSRVPTVYNVVKSRDSSGFSNVQNLCGVYGGVTYSPRIVEGSSWNVPWGMRPGTVKTKFDTHKAPPGTSLKLNSVFHWAKLPEQVRSRMFNVDRTNPVRYFKADPSKANNVFSVHYKGRVELYLIKSKKETAPGPIKKFGLTTKDFEKIKGNEELGRPHRQVTSMNKGKVPKGMPKLEEGEEVEYVHVGTIWGNREARMWESRCIVIMRDVDQNNCRHDRSNAHDYHAPRNSRGQFLPSVEY